MMKYQNLKNLLLFASALTISSTAFAQIQKNEVTLLPHTIEAQPVKNFKPKDLAKKEKESFFSTTTQKNLLSTKQVVADELASMMLTPRVIGPTDPFQESYSRKILSSSQMELFLKSFSRSKKLENTERFTNCKYLPGIKFSLYSEDISSLKIGELIEKKVADVLLCLNCDVWAVVVSSKENSNETSKRITHFIDSKKDRVALTKLYNDLFTKKLKAK